MLNEVIMDNESMRKLASASFSEICIYTCAHTHLDELLMYIILLFDEICLTNKTEIYTVFSIIMTIIFSMS